MKGPSKNFFTWYINTECNYRCSYCRPENFTTRNVSKERWIAIWDDIYARYGGCHVSFSGGEPFVYPSFIEILQGMTRKHTIEISTNLSFDVRPLVEKVDLKRVRMGCSLHPEMADFEEFMSKIGMLKKYDFEKWVTLVAYPGFLKDMKRYKERIEKEGIRFSMLPFNGKWEGRDYPKGYTEDEKKLILELCGNDEVNRRTFEFRNDEKVNVESRKKGPCMMGQKYARIYPDGRVQRCCAKGAQELGNIIDGTFRLFEEPRPCGIENCPCWKCMIVGEEDRWAKHWFVPHGTEDK